MSPRKSSATRYRVIEAFSTAAATAEAKATSSATPKVTLKEPVTVRLASVVLVVWPDLGLLRRQRRKDAWAPAAKTAAAGVRKSPDCPRPTREANIRGGFAVEKNTAIWAKNAHGPSEGTHPPEASRVRQCQCPSCATAASPAPAVLLFPALWLARRPGPCVSTERKAALIASLLGYKKDRRVAKFSRLFYSTVFVPSRAQTRVDLAPFSWCSEPSTGRRAPANRFSFRLQCLWLFKVVSPAKDLFCIVIFYALLPVLSLHTASSRRGYPHEFAARLHFSPFVVPYPPTPSYHIGQFPTAAAIAHAKAKNHTHPHASTHNPFTNSRSSYIWDAFPWKDCAAFHGPEKTRHSKQEKEVVTWV